MYVNQVEINVIITTNQTTSSSICFLEPLDLSLTRYYFSAILLHGKNTIQTRSFSPCGEYFGEFPPYVCPRSSPCVCDGSSQCTVGVLR